MRKLIMPIVFCAFMLLNAALFVFVTQQFDGSTVTTKQVVTQPVQRQR